MSSLPDPSITHVPPLPDSWHGVAYAVLAGSRLAIVAADADLTAASSTARSGETVGKFWRVAQEATAKVWWFEGDQLIESLRFELLQPWPIVEQFPDGRWLVAKSRSDGRGNARIFGGDNLEQVCFELGDGIEHIKIDELGRIWVGWFDEGVFGNADWQVPGRRWAPSGHGIGVFDDQGTLLDHANLESIADCYALNVFGEEAWACTYTDFPILRLASTGERTWSSGLSGTRAIAVRYPYILAAGGYQEDSNRVVLLKLDQDSAQELGEWRLPFDGASQDQIALLDARADELHLVLDQSWYRWRIEAFIQADE